MYSLCSLLEANHGASSVREPIKHIPPRLLARSKSRAQQYPWIHRLYTASALCWKLISRPAVSVNPSIIYRLCSLPEANPGPSSIHESIDYIPPLLCSKSKSRGQQCPWTHQTYTASAPCQKQILGPAVSVNPLIIYHLCSLPEANLGASSVREPINHILSLLLARGQSRGQ